MKILAVGSGPGWEQAPFNDASYEVWTYGLIAHLLPRVDCVFELHRRDQWYKFRHKLSVDEYIQALNILHKPIYMCKEEHDIPQSIAYPLEDVKRLVGPHFASTLSYELGLAILRQYNCKDVEEIALYGFDLLHWEEWAYQRPNVNRLIGFAQGLGINITLPAGSGLIGVPWLYGYEIDKEETRVSQALLDEDYAQLAAMMNRIGEHQLAMAYAKDQATKNGYLSQ